MLHHTAAMHICIVVLRNYFTVNLGSLLNYLGFLSANFDAVHERELLSAKPAT